MMVIRVCVLILSLVFLTHGHDHAEPYSPLPNTAIFDPDNKYHMAWDFDDEFIRFKVTVETRGYIGVGFSPNGGMKGSDIVIGWVDDVTGQGYLSDRHAVGQSEPLVDASQDYTLHYSHQNGTHTVLQISRKLHLCGDEDHFLTDETVRLIWAYSDVDPSKDGSIRYHGTNRGNKNMYLLNARPQEPPSSANMFYEDYLNPQVTIPTKRTTYWCQTFPLPRLNKKHHVIKIEPVIQPGLESELHHIVMYNCYHNVSNETVSTGYECFSRNMPSELGECTYIIAAWAVGGGPLIFPAHAGLPFGVEGDATLLMMQTHYDNPQGKQGLVDSSGFRFTLTPDLRKYDAGLLTAGETIGQGQVIPPFADSFKTVGYCHPECLLQGMGDNTQGITVFASMLHSHLLGHAMRVRHFRQGAELPVLSEDNNYDFNYQDTRMMREEVKILPGDHLAMECDYRSTNRTEVTFGGLSTMNEMCLAFLMYYPRIALGRCRTTPSPQYLASFIGAKIGESANITSPPKYAGRNLYDVLRNDVDWSKKSQRDAFQELVIQDGVDGFRVECSASDIKYPMDNNLVAFPAKIRSEPPSQTCSGDQAGRTSFLMLITLVMILAACI